MAAADKLKIILLKKMIRASRRRQRMLEMGAACVLYHHNLKISACLIYTMLLLVQNPRAGRRMTRNTGWWDQVSTGD